MPVLIIYRLLGAMPFAIVTYFALWYVPDVSLEWKFLYYFGIYCAFMTFETVRIYSSANLTMLKYVGLFVATMTAVSANWTEYGQNRG